LAQLVEFHLHAVVEQLAAWYTNMLHVPPIIWLGTPLALQICYPLARAPHLPQAHTQYSYQQRLGTKSAHKPYCKPVFPHFCLPKPPVEKFFSVHKYLSLVSHVIKFDQHADVVSCALAASAMPTLSGTACSSFHIATNTNCTHQRPGG